MPPRRLALFIDYQNVYQRCRGAFHLDGDDATNGQVDPLKVGRLVASLESNARLERVFVYRGEPNAHMQAYANAACRRQVHAWRSLRNVEVHTRPLQYVNGADPREKGIDVKLAIDCVRAALSGNYDIIAVFSGDSDLAPAVEFIYDGFRKTGVKACSVAWMGGPEIPLQDDRKLWCHRLSYAHYETVRDQRNYAQR